MSWTVMVCVAGCCFQHRPSPNCERWCSCLQRLVSRFARHFDGHLIVVRAVASSIGISSEHSTVVCRTNVNPEQSCPEP